MPDDSPTSLRQVTIVGAGFAGTILAAELARRGVSAWLVEGDGKAGRGTAYSTLEPAHLLNVPAHSMSAFADDPDHFLRRFAAEEGGERGDFAPRRYYGAYLADILEQAVATGLIETIDGNAVAATRSDGWWRVTLGDGRALHSAALVVAIGNEAPGGLRALDGIGPRYAANPWGSAAADAVALAVAEGGDVLIVGTGLTMVDTVLSLDEAGFGGRITALSRRGLAPRAHAAFEPAPVALDEIPQGSPRALLRWLRRRAATTGWRAAIDALRPHSHAIWDRFDLDQKRAFLRHARPWWDVHRHRIAPQIAERIAGLVAEGRLNILAGRVTGAQETERGARVAIIRRGSTAPQTHEYAAIINCTGPLHGMSHTANPLLRSLLEGDLARPDPLDIGLAVDGRARADGADRLWAMGALTKGRYWEIIAVPDIRGQAADIAAQIGEELGHD